MSERLLIFTRYPEPHKSKTRLIPCLGPEGAARLQREMTRHTLRWAGQLAHQRDVEVEVHFTGGDESAMRESFGSQFLYRRQNAGDLGARLSAAFEAASREGARRTVIVGTDCPGITPALVGEAFDHLGRADAVIGPAADGGYYLIGLQRPVARLFTGISWGTSRVFHETHLAAAAAGLRATLLPVLPDVDHPEDLPVWENASRSSLADDDTLISVIIPTLDEEAMLGRTLQALNGATNIEVLVVDGGSRDQTIAVAEAHGCRVLAAPRGRASQMNAGAAAASGSILLFLHADTLLPPSFEQHIRRALAKPGVAAGAFRLAIDGPQRALRVIEWGVDLRSRALGMPYGDQALFVRPELFFRAGKFPPLPIMEDFELVRRLRRHGRVSVVSVPVLTSARRWQKVGPWRTTLINQLLVVAHCMGVAPWCLARWYRQDSAVDDFKATESSSPWQQLPDL